MKNIVPCKVAVFTLWKDEFDHFVNNQKYFVNDQKYLVNDQKYLVNDQKSFVNDQKYFVNDKKQKQKKGNDRSKAIFSEMKKWICRFFK